MNTKNITLQEFKNIIKSCIEGQAFLNPKQNNNCLHISIPFSGVQKDNTNSISFFYDPENDLAEQTPNLIIILDDIVNIKEVCDVSAVFGNCNYSEYGNNHILITLKNSTEILICFYDFSKQNNDIDKDDFIEMLVKVNGKSGGFIINNTNWQDDCENGTFPLEINSVYYDSCKTICNNKIISFENQKDSYVKNGKEYSTMYSFGSICIYAKNIKRVVELYDEENIICEPSVDRAFGLELHDDENDTSYFMTIGLL